jgi:ABC-2 type transport system permease protein
MFYFGFGFEFYNISRLANLAELWTLVVPFLLSVTFLGITLGQLIQRSELATLLVLLSSMPIVFMAGFVWPVSAIPAPINMVAQLVPAVPGIQAFLRLNQMGADFAQIIKFWGQLWALAALYGASSWWLLRRNNQQGDVIV